MFAWLNGPGRAFREPLNGSTNYLGAYDRSGKLRRGNGRALQENDEAKLEKNKKKEDEEDEDDLDDVEKEQRREAKKSAAANAEAKDARRERGPETPQDLRPFPLNQNFRSQSVLSEELREQLWKEVSENKRSVSTVSAVYGVDMRRVGAVVRLKTVEKEWIAQVSQPIFLLQPPPHSMMINKKNSISLEDKYMVTNFSMRASLIMIKSSSSYCTHCRSSVWLTKNVE